MEKKNELVKLATESNISFAIENIEVSDQDPRLVAFEIQKESPTGIEEKEILGTLSDLASIYLGEVFNCDLDSYDISVRSRNEIVIYRLKIVEYSS